MAELVKSGKRDPVVIAYFQFMPGYALYKVDNVVYERIVVVYQQNFLHETKVYILLHLSLMKGIKTYINSQVVREKMNKAGKERQPFLFAVDFEMESGLFVDNPLNQNDVLFRVGDVKNFPESIISPNESLLRIKDLIKYENYSEKFNVVMGGLKRGDTYLINLTAKTEIESSLSLRNIFCVTQSLFGICAWEDFVSFSPERFVRIENGIISSCPMKGTIDASIPNAVEIILNDYKESCEHNTIVDLLRNDIGKVSGRVWVEKFRYIDKIETDRGDILQVSSDIRGELQAGYRNNLGDTIFSMLPAGSVSGAPKSSTLRLIPKAEGEKRGFYTGVFGYFDGAVLDSAVLIRFIEKESNGAFFYHSGGGVTVNSICKDEYEELIAKIYLPLKK